MAGPSNLSSRHLTGNASPLLPRFYHLVKKDPVFYDNQAINADGGLIYLTVHMPWAMYDNITPDIVTQGDVYPVMVMGSITPIIYIIIFEVGRKDTHLVDCVCRGIAAGDKRLQPFYLDGITAHIYYPPCLHSYPQWLTIRLISRPNIQLSWTIHNKHARCRFERRDNSYLSIEWYNPQHRHVRGIWPQTKRKISAQ